MLTAIIFFAILYYVFRDDNEKSDLLPFCLLGILLFGMDDD